MENTSKVTKVTPVKLIKDEFEGISLGEMKALTKEDRLQLGSAIAWNRGISQENCDFELVDY